MEVVKWIFVVAELAGVALVLVDLVIKEPDDAAASDRLPDGLAGTGERKTPDGRGLAGVRWRGVYEAKGRKWVVREAPKESHKADTTYRNSITDVIRFSTIL